MVSQFSSLSPGLIASNCGSGVKFSLEVVFSVLSSVALSGIEVPMPSKELDKVDCSDEAGNCDTREVSALDRRARGAFGDTGEFCPDECGVSVDF